MPHQCTECSRVFADGSKQMLAGCPDCGGNKFQFRPKGTVSVSEEPTPEPETTNQPRQREPEKTRTTTLREWARRKVTPGSSTADGGTAASSSATATQGTPSASTSRSQSASNGGPSTASTKLDSFAGESDERPDDQGTANSTEADPAEADPTEAALTDVDEPNATADGSDDPQEDAAQADARSGVVGENELPDPPATDDEERPPEDHEPRPDLAQLREELNDQFESIKVVEPGQYELNLMELYDRQEYIIALQENGRYVIDVPDAWDATE